MEVKDIESCFVALKKLCCEFQAQGPALVIAASSDSDRFFLSKKKAEELKLTRSFLKGVFGSSPEVVDSSDSETDEQIILDKLDIADDLGIALLRHRDMLWHRDTVEQHRDVTDQHVDTAERFQDVAEQHQDEALQQAVPSDSLANKDTFMLDMRYSSLVQKMEDLATSLEDGPSMDDAFRRASSNLPESFQALCTLLRQHVYVMDSKCMNAFIKGLPPSVVSASEPKCGSGVVHFRLLPEATVHYVCCVPSAHDLLAPIRWYLEHCLAARTDRIDSAVFQMILK